VKQVGFNFKFAVKEKGSRVVTGESKEEEVMNNRGGRPLARMTSTCLRRSRNVASTMLTSLSL